MPDPNPTNIFPFSIPRFNQIRTYPASIALVVAAVRSKRGATQWYPRVAIIARRNAAIKRIARAAAPHRKKCAAGALGRYLLQIMILIAGQILISNPEIRSSASRRAILLDCLRTPIRGRVSRPRLTRKAFIGAGSFDIHQRGNHLDIRMPHRKFAKTSPGNSSGGQAGIAVRDSSNRTATVDDSRRQLPPNIYFVVEAR